MENLEGVLPHLKENLVEELYDKWGGGPRMVLRQALMPGNVGELTAFINSMTMSWLDI